MKRKQRLGREEAKTGGERKQRLERERAELTEAISRRAHRGLESLVRRWVAGLRPAHGSSDARFHKCRNDGVALVNRASLDPCRA